MRTEDLKSKAGPLSTVLVALAVLLGAVTLVVTARFLVASASSQLAAARTLRPASVEPNVVAEQRTLSQSVADALKKKNLFVSSPPATHPVTAVLGILGDEALINDTWYKAGDRIGDARILAIEATKVVIIWNGQTGEFSPIGSGDSPGPAGVASRSGSRTRRAAPDDRGRRRERIRTMSPEEQQKFRDEMRGRAAGRSR